MPDHSPNRGTILSEQAEIVARQEYPGAQYILTLSAPRIAARAEPGSFTHITCGDDLPMRRPMSIMHADGEAGTFDILFKDVGTGTAMLAKQPVGTRLSVLGPIGKSFTPLAERPRALLLGGGVGIPPMLFLAEALVRSGTPPALVVMGSEVPFPFENRLSDIAVPGVTLNEARAVPELEAMGVPSRLASAAGIPGSFDGYVTQLADAWLATLTEEELAQVAVYACGPNAMLHATAVLAARYGLPSQVSLEEFMACGVGGCAGCAVHTVEPTGEAMRRVCVDGPVFDGAQVAWPTLGFAPLTAAA